MFRWDPTSRGTVPVAVALILVMSVCAQIVDLPVAFAAAGDITTIAGNGNFGYSGDNGPATAASLANPTGEVEDASGNIYVADLGNHVVRKVDPSGTITTVAGNGTDGFSGDNGPATAAELSQPFAVVMDPTGNLYIADQSENRIREVDHASGVITTFAGNGSSTSGGDGGPATSASLVPQFMAFTSAGLFVADYPGALRKIDNSGVISTVAGGLNGAQGVGADGEGNLYVTEIRANVVDRIDSTGTKTVVAGNGSAGDSGDGGPATGAQLNLPYDVKVAGGVLYISEYYGDVVRKVDPFGTITAFAGNYSCCYSGDGGPATAAHLNGPTGLAIGPHGDVLIADYNNNVIRRVEGSPDLLSLAVRGLATVRLGAPFAYQLRVNNDGSVGPASNVVVSDTLPAGASFVNATSSKGSCAFASSTVTCTIGSMPASEMVSITIDVMAPMTVGSGIDTASVTQTEVDPNVSDNSASVTTSYAQGTGFIYPLAGNGTSGYTGDGGPSPAALVNSPGSVRTDTAGNVYFTDNGNNVVRKIDPLGVITTFAGTGTAGFSGDGGAASSAELNAPGGLAIDGKGDVFIADASNQRIREVDPSGIIRTVAGSGGRGFNSGDGLPATQATLGGIGGVAVDAAGNFYISAESGNQVRKVDATTGLIARFTGTGLQRTRGDGGPASVASLATPRGMFVDGSNNLYIASGFPSNVIRKVNLYTGIISTVAGATVGDGTGNLGGSASGDGGPATQATLAEPTDVNVDPSGNIYFPDPSGFETTDNAIRKVDTNGIISTVAGGLAAGYSGDGGPATAASLSGPNSVAPLGHGSFVLTDGGNNAMRIVTGTPDLLSLAKAAPLTVAPGGSFAYHLVVRNDGSDLQATGVVLTDTLPAGVAFASAAATQGSCAGSGATVTCNLGTVPGNSSAQVTINVSAPSLSTAITNTASVTANESDPITADNTATATTYVNAADVVVSLAASPNPGADVGAPVTYTATVTNRGPSTATGVKFTDALPAGLTLGSIAIGQGTCTHSGATVSCSIGTMAAGATTTATIHVTPTTAGSRTDSATVSADQVDPYTFNNTASLTMFVSGAGCGKAITKSTSLKADIGPCSGDGVIIGADNIRVNLNGHKVFGMGNGKDFAVTDDLVGIRLPNRTGVIISGGTVSGFDTGIFLNSGLNNTITKMTVQDNIGQNSDFFFPDLGDGILIEYSAHNTITSNTINHNGTYDGIGVFGLDTNYNLIQGNTITNTITSTSKNDGEGVIINNFLSSSEPRRGESIAHNNVIGNTIVGNAASGISNVSNIGALIENNTVKNNGLLAFPSNGIGDQVGRVANPTASDTVSGNYTSGNGEDGIEILSPLNGDTISGNTAVSNNALNDGSFNLEDTNGNCTANAWSQNTSTKGAISPSCLTSAATPAASPKAGPASNAAPSTATGSTTTPPVPQSNRRLLPRATG